MTQKPGHRGYVQPVEIRLSSTRLNTQITAQIKDLWLKYGFVVVNSSSPDNIPSPIYWNVDCLQFNQAEEEAVVAAAAEEAKEKEDITFKKRFWCLGGKNNPGPSHTTLNFGFSFPTANFIVSWILEKPHSKNVKDEENNIVQQYYPLSPFSLPSSLLSTLSSTTSWCICGPVRITDEVIIPRILLSLSSPHWSIWRRDMTEVRAIQNGVSDLLRAPAILPTEVGECLSTHVLPATPFSISIPPSAFSTYSSPSPSDCLT
ncbi:hypothetical protein ECG_03326 [Echinococcus granulosus]|uniref:Expressed conserved protein n=1 Tax=Echinococcus granulosus TaxID=6210 RepID=A0A068WZQ9_ECHGR|nr:hypothetical protein ECG_03326 [Echinococcus granulosus]CDS23996.1 hypothetical protein EgrG_002048100 [Echinococcus granulosus]